MEQKEIEEYGVRLTIFDNGDVFISTKGDVHVLHAKRVWTE